MTCMDWEQMIKRLEGAGLLFGSGMTDAKSTHYMHVLRKQAVWFSKGLPDAASFRTKVYQTQSKDEVMNIIEEFFTSTAATWQS